MADLPTTLARIDPEHLRDLESSESGRLRWDADDLDIAVSNEARAVRDRAGAENPAGQAHQGACAAARLSA